MNEWRSCGDKKAMGRYWVPSWRDAGFPGCPLESEHMAPSAPWPQAWWYIGARWRQDWGALVFPMISISPTLTTTTPKLSTKANCLPYKHIFSPGSPLTLLPIEILPLRFLSGTLELPSPSQVHLRQSSFPWGRNHVSIIFYTQYCRATAPMTTVGLNMDLLKPIHHPALRVGHVVALASKRNNHKFIHWKTPWEISVQSTLQFSWKINTHYQFDLRRHTDYSIKSIVDKQANYVITLWGRLYSWNDLKIISYINSSS